MADVTNTAPASSTAHVATEGAAAPTPEAPKTPQSLIARIKAELDAIPHDVVATVKGLVADLEKLIP